MKKFLKQLVLILAIVVLITSCNQEKPEQIEMGRYIEDDIALPTTSLLFVDLLEKDNQLELYAYDNLTKTFKLYKSQDSITWEGQPIDWLQSFNSTCGNGDISNLSYGSDNNLYILYNGYSNNSLVPNIAVIKDNVATKLEMQWNSDDKLYVDNLTVTDSIFVSNLYDRQVQRYDLNGNFLSDYKGSEFTINDNKIITSSGESNGIVIYDIEAGDIQQEIEYKDFDSSTIGYKFICDKEGENYIVDNKGVQQILEDGTLSNIIDGELTSFIDQTLLLKEIISFDNKFVAIFTNKSGVLKAKNYIYSENIPKVPQKQLTVYTLYNSPTLNQAVAEYQNLHDDTKINIIKSMEESTNKSDVIRALNTELLAGKGPDLILLDKMPIDSYIEKGVLQNMNGLINTEDLNDKVINTYDFYAIPLRFDLPTMWGDEQDINSFTDLDSLIKWYEANPFKDLFVNVNYRDLIEEFYPICAPSFLKQNQIDRDNLIKFLEDLKTLKTLNKLEEITKKIKIGATASLNYDFISQFESKNTVVEFYYSDTNLYLKNLRGYSELMLPVAAIQNRKNGNFNTMLNQDIYIPKNIIGINSNTKYKEETKDFVNLALSETIQSLDLYDGFAVNNKSFENGALNTNMGSVYFSSDDRSVSAIAPAKIYFDRLNELVKQIKTPSTVDDTLVDLIVDEAKGYFDNQKTVEQVADSIVERTQAYFSE